MVCTSCKFKNDEDSSFCKNCGANLKITINREFELGKIHALDTIKSDVLKWFGGISIIISIIGFFGINELITSTIDKRVQEDIDREFKGLEEDIAESRLKIIENVFDANKQTKKLNASMVRNSTLMDSLILKSNNITNITNNVSNKSRDLKNLLNNNQKQNSNLSLMITSTTARQKELDSIINAENLTLIMSQLKHDFTTTKFIKAKMVIRVERKFKDSIDLVVNLINRIDFRSTTDNTDWSGMEFSEDKSRVTSVESDKYTEYHKGFSLYAPFEDKYIGSSMNLLSGMDTLTTSCRFLTTYVEHNNEEYYTKEELQSVLKRFEKKLQMLNAVEIQFFLNQYPICSFNFSKDDIMNSELEHKFEANQFEMYYSLTKNVENEFMNVVDRYKSLIKEKLTID